MVELSPAEQGLYRMGYAGDTFNTAWYMNKLSGDEIETHYYSAIGDDAASQDMARFIEGSGIGFEPCIIPGASVGLYMISLNDGERSFSYWRSASAARQFAEHLDELPGVHAGDMVFFSGITIAILLPQTRARFLELVARARLSGVQICFDPNLRPRLWNSTQDMCDWTMRAAAQSDIVLPSFEDEAEFFQDANSVATAQRYHQQGARLVVVKDGPNDVIVSQNGSDRLNVAPVRVPKMIDSTAAGDSFNAGFLAGYLQGAELVDAVQQGCQVSAQVIMRPGALVDLSI